MPESVGYADIGLAAPSGASKHLLLRAGDRFFAVPILEVREVLPRQDYVRLPGAGPAVCGLISVRSRVLTVLDFAAAVGLGRSSAGADHRVVVLEHGERSVGLAVDAVVEIAELVPEALSASGEKPVEGDPEAPYLVAVGEAAGFRFAVIGVSELVAAWLA